MLSKKFRDLIIGKHTYIVSWVDYKNAILSGHLIVVAKALFTSSMTGFMGFMETKPII